MSGLVPPSPVDLTNCDREPIHLLGTIQPFGFLIAATADWTISRASANAGAWLGVPPSADGAAALVGTSLRERVSVEGVHAIGNRLAMLRDQSTPERAFGVPLVAGHPPFDIAVHMSGTSLVLEAEPTDPADSDMRAGTLVRSMMARLQALPDPETVCREAARQLRALTGFDRVMVYRFHEDGSGEVIAEAARNGIGSFLGQRYPASDIPRQARHLYERNWIRIIADVDAAPVPVLPATDPAGDPLDLSMSVLRAVSPIHVEYLRNMGVRASLSVSILRQGRLWGLFACHHYAPRRIGFERRTAAELFGQIFSLLLEGREREVIAEYEARARRLNDRLLARMAAASGGAAAETLGELAEPMAELVPCDGIAVVAEGEVTLWGTTPTREELAGLLRFLNGAAASRVYATDEIGAAHPPGRDFAARAAGLLAIPISRTPRDYVLFFRREQSRTITWAGDPSKPATLGPNGPRLTPRKSFEAWSETVRGKAPPWTEPELRVAEALRVTLLEVVLRLTGLAEEERRSASQRQELLIAELNHRVRNVLGLIRGLVSQSRSGSSSLPEFVGMLGGRIDALARAHDQITADQWGPAPLETLVVAEAAAYLNAKADRVRCEGPKVLLAPQAFSTLALVVHELMSNSAKYGALSDSRGRIALQWRIDETGDLHLDWSESDGPAVRPPTRRGFGSTIIERSIPHDLQGSARIEYRLAGVRAAFRVPSRYVVADAAGAGQEQVAAPAARRPPGLPVGLSGTVLLVEDNMVIALDAEDMLRKLGAARVEVASRATEALRLIDVERPSFALLDVNLGEETSFAVADRLRALGVPHVFATGYGEEAALPPEHAGTPVLKKPYSLDALALKIRDG
jgi:light-regulated signal transduction histidine kinase (bacteriophytochrome)/CheY-like chemotaxis protein